MLRPWPHSTDSASPRFSRMFLKTVPVVTVSDEPLTRMSLRTCTASPSRSSLPCASLTTMEGSGRVRPSMMRAFYAACPPNGQRSAARCRSVLVPLPDPVRAPQVGTAVDAGYVGAEIPNVLALFLDVSRRAPGARALHVDELFARLAAIGMQRLEEL